MRTILNISIPKKEEKKIKERVKKWKFDSVSEYIRSLIDLDSELISSGTLLKLSEKSHTLYSAGKLKKLKSLKDLIK